MLANITAKLRNCTCTARKYATSALSTTDNSTSTSIEPRTLTFPPKYQEPRQIWLESLDSIDQSKLGLLEIHPSVFAARPRIDVIHQNVSWQKMYRYVSYAHTKSRFEVRGGGRKPWPQKGIVLLKLVFKTFPD